MIKKNLWIRNVLSRVEEIADREYQERAWLKHQVYKPCSWEEMMCSLFDDCWIEEFIHKKVEEFGFSLEQKTALFDLVSALDNYGDNPELYFPTPPLSIDEAKVFIDPEWHKIQKMAERVLTIFGKIKYAPEDKQWWLRYIFNAIFDYGDIDKQKQMWIDKTATFWSTPLDMYEGLFNSCEFDYFMDEYAKKFGLTEEQIALLDQFRSQLKKTPFKTVNPENVLRNPDWKNLQTLACKASNSLGLP